ncbi:branched-chain amino acid ABC transporter permease [Ferrovibrio sp.]|uniref:branched-chain amino acid ABC transporter permease n=1 Tax=Ferrovibrio sp. TaxID=1917215 RepID=UPI0026306277|nr:branched-chain amino acid ABC transporter permease [Ferrovibrio sp.]
MTAVAATTETVSLPKVKTDWLPALLVPILAVAALPLVGSFSTWVTLTVAALAMGMMIFLMASGLTLVFGLMDVLNFGHGVFISFGAYVSLMVLGPLAGWVESPNIWLNIGVLLACIVVAMLVTGALGYAFERVVIRPVYGQHLKQILITMGGMIVAEQMIHVIWGASPIPLRLPEGLRGAIVVGEAAMEKYRVIAVVLGLLVFGLMHLLLNRTKIGLLIRAGVENAEMVEALGYRIRRLFVGVFIAGSALAGLGGVLWAFYRQTLTAGMGMEVNVLIFIVIIIGGLGSIGGCFVGALLVALVANYTGFLAPKLALGSSILLMVLILLWRPQGLYPVAKR